MSSAATTGGETETETGTNGEEEEEESQSVYYFDENDVKQRLEYSSRREQSAQIESNYADILGRLKLILTEKTAELNTMMELSEALKATSELNRSELSAIASQDEEVVFYSPKEKGRLLPLNKPCY